MKTKRPIPGFPATDALLRINRSNALENGVRKDPSAQTDTAHKQTKKDNKTPPDFLICYSIGNNAPRFKGQRTYLFIGRNKHNFDYNIKNADII
ncbi:MAG: hypothetical protein PUC11_03755 [Elusimicrobia bacterium]|nr:hypothetical protein [Elusimicrobiota bacterium]